jgi:hypothetical protein
MSFAVTGLLDELGALLGRVSGLVSLCETGAAEFPAETTTWFREAEGVLARYHRPQVSQVAGLRAQLLSAIAGIFDTRTLRLPEEERSSRKLKRAVVALLLDQGQRVVGSIHDAYAARRDEATTYMRQMVILALQKGTFYPVWNSTAQRSEALVRVWLSFLADSAMLAASRHVLSLVNYADALRLLDEIATGWGL